MNREELMKHAEIAMDVAKQNVTEKGKVLPTLVMIMGKDKPMIMSPISDKNMLPLVLKKEKPEAFTWAIEIWVHTPESPERKEAIEVMGGSGITRVLIRQPFHRQDGKIMFDKSLVFSDYELAGYMVNQGLRDSTMGEIMGLWSPAPSGGRLFYVPPDSGGFKIWIPEGWRMAREMEADTGKPRPTFYRDNPMGHGAVRVTVMWRKAGESSNPGLEARTDAEKRRQTTGVDSVQLEEKPEAVTVNWVQIVQEPGQDHPTKMNAWHIHDREGLMLVTFAHDATTSSAEIADELASVRQIVSRIGRL